MKILNTSEDAYGNEDASRQSKGYNLTQGQVPADNVGEIVRKVPVPKYMDSVVSYSGDESFEMLDDLELLEEFPNRLTSFQEYNMVKQGYVPFRVEGQENVEAVVKGLQDAGYDDLVAKTKSFDGIKPMSENFVTVYARKV